MDNIYAATVIPFPRRSGPIAAPLPQANDDDDDDAGDADARLRRALTALDAALAAQRDAVARWRGALGSLDGSMRGLHASLQGFGGRLGELHGQVDAVGETARGLAAWADSALAAVPATDLPQVK